MPNGIDYTDAEWRMPIGHGPIGRLAAADRLLLHRHWMWANQQREAFDRFLQNPAPEILEPGPLMMATREMGFMFIWYGLLWSVIEACVGGGGRGLDIKGPFREDIDRMSDLLRRCRNAVMHVPGPGQLLDERIVKLVSEPDAVTFIRRIHRGFGRMFLESFKCDIALDAQRPAG
jgi:hypothetical protein